MTTNKPEVKRYDCTSGGAQHCYGCYTMKECELGDYVEWEAYEALQAECEKLRKDAERYRWLRDKSEPLHSFYLSTPVWMTGVRFHPENVNRTIDAAMQEGN